jgi:hypothetical protein
VSLSVPRLSGRFRTRYARDTPIPPRTAVQAFRALWRDTAEGCGLARVVHVAAGVTVSVPRVGGVRVDPDTGHVASATIQRHPGQSIAEYRAAAPLLADALGCARVRIDDLGAARWLRLHLLDDDPLAASRAWHRRLPDGFLAVCEDGSLFSAPWERRPHSVTQGSTGSGKSSWTYGQLAPLAGRCDVRVVGIDPSGLLWRPWLDDAWRVSGVAGDLLEQRRVLWELCAEMDRRLTLLPDGADNLVTDAGTPLLVVVLEEYAALVRAAELVDRKVGLEVRALVGRLYSEGRKVGVRCLMLLQRSDVAIVDGAIRAQATLRVSFASEAEGIAMLHPRNVIDPDEHAVAEPGVCAITAPRVGTFRARSVLLDYRRYVALVREGSRR